MKKRLKSLSALIMTCILCLQLSPITTQAEIVIRSSEFLLTEEELTDGYVLQSGGSLRFDENLTVDGYVNFDSGSGTLMYLTIPASSTMNGEITILDGMGIVDNSGTITSDIELSAGTLENKGKVGNVTINGSGMVYASDGASFDELDASAAGSGMVVTSGTISVESLILNAYGLSVGDSGATQFDIGDQIKIEGTTEIDDMYKISVGDSVKITTEGQSGLFVYCGGTKYPLPATTLTAKTLGEIYSVSTDKSSLSFTEQAVGYQTSESKTFTVTNNGLADVTLQFAMGGEWDDMFKVTSGAATITTSSELSLAKGASLSFDVTSKKGLSVASHTGTLSVKYCTSEGTAYETQKITGKLTVTKEPSISVPSGEFYTLSGTEGNNGFYTSNVKVTPVDGYSIAKTLSDDFTDTITYTESKQKPTVYLQKNSTGQITEKATLSAIKIDKEKPTVKNASSGKTYYKSTLTVTVTDDNLESVTLNSGGVTVTDGKAEIVIAGTDDKVKHTLRAEDGAGNVRVVTFYLAPEWMEDGTVPSGKTVTLYKDTQYSFGSGTWTVSGDTTSYAGGVTFYVANDGQYTFQSSN